MDEEVKKLCDDLCNEWMKNNTNSSISLYMYSLPGRVESKLSELANRAERLQRELDILKVQSDVWKQSYLDQVKENVLMQATLLKGDK